MHVQATSSFNRGTKQFRRQAMANEPVLLAALEYRPHGFLQGTYGMSPLCSDSDHIGGFFLLRVGGRYWR